MVFVLCETVDCASNLSDSGKRNAKKSDVCVVGNDIPKLGANSRLQNKRMATVRTSSTEYREKVRLSAERTRHTASSERARTQARVAYLCKD